MDFRDVIEKCVVVGIDVCFMGLFYRLYKVESKNLKALESAQHLDLDHELPQKIKDSGGEIPYAAISSKVKALNLPLASDYVAGMEGVIKKNITKEYRATWVPFLRMWSTTDVITKQSVVHVPFGLFSRTGLLKRPAVVEVVDPLFGSEMVFTEIHKDFKVHDGSLADALIGLILREHTVGIQEAEYMLLDSTAVTAVGKLILNKDNAMRIMPPDNDMPYYLTPYSYNVLVQKIKGRISVYKNLTLVMCALSSILLAYFVKKGYQEVLRRKRMASDLKKRQEARKAAREAVSDNTPRCVVCIENPVEIIVLECGHACLCFNCSEERFEFCPVCRRQVDRTVPVYIP